MKDDTAHKPPKSQPPGSDRRLADRFDVTWSVDCETEDTFLYASISNISAIGIFVRTDAPLPLGTEVVLRFAPHDGGEQFVLRGAVQWVNEVHVFGANLNPGMGVRFFDLTPADRERLVEAIHTIAYVREASN